MAIPVEKRVQKRRDALSAAGLRRVQIRVPDTRRPGFSEDCRRQSLIVAAADASGHELQRFLDAAFTGLGDESET